MSKSKLIEFDEDEVRMMIRALILLSDELMREKQESPRDFSTSYQYEVAHGLWNKLSHEVKFNDD